MRRALLVLACIAASVSAYADAFTGAAPAPVNTPPPATALDGTAGSAMTYARADHTHAARVQRTAITTASDGTATWTFSRPITVPTGAVPVIAVMVEDTGSPVVVQVTGRTFTSAGGVDTHTAVSIKAQRSQVLPATLVSVAALVGFNTFAGNPASVKVNLFAADPTQ